MLKKQNCAIWIQTVSFYILKQVILIKTLQKILQLDLILQIKN